MLRHLFSIFVLFFFLNSNGLSQCSINIPDTLCPQQSVTIQSSNAFLSVDFCPNRLDSLVFSNALPTFAGTQIKVINDRGRYYMFSPDFGTSFIRNYEFNSQFNSLYNANFGVLAANDSCIYSVAYDMAPIDSVKWVAFKADLNFNHLYKITFDSLTDPSPDFVYLGDYNLASSYMMCIYDHYLFITNSATNTITRILFNDDYSVVVYSDVLTGNFYSPIGIDVVFDCVTNGYYALVGNIANSTITRIDFGNSLGTISPATTVLSTNVGPVRGLEIYNQQNDWYAITNTYPENRLRILKLGSILDTALTTVFDTSSDPVGWGVELLIDSSRLHVFATYAITHFQFQGCFSNTTWLEHVDSVTLNYALADTNYNYLELTLTDSTGVKYINYDSVFVAVTAPKANFFTGGTCEGQPILFFDSSTICYGSIVNWLWDFGDNTQSTLQNPVHQYATGGTLNVTLTAYAANGDSNSVTIPIKMVQLPVADFSMSSAQVCAFNAVVFTDQSSSLNDSIVNWSWSFGDNNYSQLQNPTANYSLAGTYSIQLVVTNSSGCIDSVSQTLLVLPAPQAAFKVAGTCINSLAIFENFTDSSGIDTVNYFWNFGDGNSSTDAFAVHTYNAIDSIYKVQLIATANNGCQSMVTDSVIIAAPALVSFSISEDTVCQNFDVTFINTTVSNNQPVIKKAWYFSDGFYFENVDTIVHSFSQSGTYSIMLVVTTATNCDTAYTALVQVLNNPEANFVFTNVCYNDSNWLVNSSIATAGDNIVNYTWNFGDASTLVNATSVYHQYANPGVYSVMLTINSAKGCIDSINKAVNVYALPVANFIAAQVLCSDSANLFSDFSFVNSNDTIIAWWWDFGDSNTSTNQNPSNDYIAAGSYQVQHIVETQKGCRDTILKPITVKQSPSPFFSYDSTCYGNLTNFNFINLAPSTGLINSWNWNFGEFGTGNSNLQNPTHLYANPSSYAVTVMAADTNQCFSESTQTVTINDLPKPGFFITNPCEESLAIFTDTSTVVNGTIVQWSWSINGNSISTDSVVEYGFNLAGTYPVQLAVVSNYGCANSIIKPVIIYDLPVASFSVNPPYATPGQVVTFSNTSVNASFFNWSFGDGYFSHDDSPTHIYSDTNNYLVNMIATSNNGCIDTSSITYSILFPQLEMAVVDVNFVIKNSLMSISAQLINLGNIDINSYNLIARFDEIPILIESSVQPITVKNPALIYNFKSKLVVNNNFNPDYFCIEAILPNGGIDNPLNNTKCKALNNTMQLLNLAPNPAINVLQLFINAPYTQDVSLKVFDMLGRQIVSSTVLVKKGFSFVDLNVSFLDNGLYNLSIYNGSETLNAVFEKQ